MKTMASTNLLEMTLYCGYCCFAITLGIIVNRKLYRNVKNEEHLEKGKVIQRILKTFARVQSFGWPVIISFAFGLKLNSEVLHMIPMPFVYPCIKVLRAMYTMMNNYVGFNSLIIAMTRYIFVVYDRLAQKIGIRRLRCIFLSLSVSIPMLTSILNESINPVEEVWYSIFVPDYKYSEEKKSGMNITVTSTISPLLSVPDLYVPSLARGGIQIFWLIMMISIYSNILEGFIYLHIFIDYIR